MNVLREEQVKHTTLDSHITNVSNPHLVTPEQIGAIPADGWVQDFGWVKSTATQFARAGNHAYLFPKGTRICWQEFSGPYKYGVVSSSSYSTYTYINLIPNNTYSIGTSPSAAWFSPFADVGIFSYTPTFSADSGGVFYNLNVVQAFWSMVGNVMKLDVAFQILDKGTTAGHLHFTAPANAALTGTGGGFEAGVTGIWSQLVWTSGGTDILCRGGDGRSMLV